MTIDSYLRLGQGVELKSMILTADSDLFWVIEVISVYDPSHFFAAHLI